MKTLCFALIVLLATIAHAADQARIVITPVVYGQPEVKKAIVTGLGQVFGVQTLTTVENPGLTAYIVDRLVNSRKFSVLERARLETVVRELDFGESDYANTAKIVKMGQMLNADYVLVPEIRHFNVRQADKTVPYVNTVRTDFEAVLGITSRIVEVKTSQILASKIGDVRLRSRAKKENPQQEAIDFVEAVYSRCADDMVGRVLDAVYPIKIVEVNGTTVLVNRGDDFLKAGQRLILFKAGRALVDPDTGASLGQAESVVGRVEIVRANAKFSEGRVLESASPVEVGFILRMVSEEAAPAVGDGRKVNW